MLKKTVENEIEAMHNSRYKQNLFVADCMILRPSILLCFRDVSMTTSRVLRILFLVIKRKMQCHFFSGLEELSMGLFLSAEAALSVQSAFDFPNRLLHEYFSENQANHNLPFVNSKMQVSGRIL